MFFKPEDYEIVCLGENESVELSDENAEIYTKITGQEYLIEDEGGKITLREDIPKYVQINQKTIEDILKKNKELSAYNPLEDAPSLYTELAKIKYFDYKSLDKFIKNFGLPVGRDLFPTDIYSGLAFEMDAFRFYECLYKFKKALNIYEALQSNDETKINLFAKEFESYVQDETERAISESLETIIGFKKGELDKLLGDYGDYYNYLNKYSEFIKKEAAEIKTMPGITQHWLKVKNESPEVKALNYLTELMNNWKKGDLVYTVIDEQIQQGLVFVDLLDVAFYQLSKAILWDAEFRECKNCHNIFEVDDGKRFFCPPLPGRKTSACQNAYNQRMKRKNKKEQLKQKETRP